MTNIPKKPRFEELTTMGLPDFGLKFNSQLVGPAPFKELRKGNYGDGFRMFTMPEIVPLVYAALKNQEVTEAKKVKRFLGNNWYAANTGVRYTTDGIFVQDNPRLKAERIFMDPEDLESKLGSQEIKGVTFSDDRRIRFVPYGFKTEIQTIQELETNPGVIAVTSSIENAEITGLISAHYKRAKPYFCVLSNLDAGQTRFTGLRFMIRPWVLADHPENGFKNFFAFGTSDNYQDLEIPEMKIINLSSLLPGNKSYNDSIGDGSESPL